MPGPSCSTSKSGSCRIARALRSARNAVSRAVNQFPPEKLKLLIQMAACHIFCGGKIVTSLLKCPAHLNVVHSHIPQPEGSYRCHALWRRDLERVPTKHRLGAAVSRWFGYKRYPTVYV
jgi:hypothetical protein